MPQTRLHSSLVQRQNPCSSVSPPVYPDLSTCHDWPVKKAIFDLPIIRKRNLKCISSNSLSLFGAQNKNVGTALQSSLTVVRLSMYVCDAD